MVNKIYSSTCDVSIIHIKVFIISVLLFLSSYTQAEENESLDLYIILGQSNACGSASFFKTDEFEKDEFYIWNQDNSNFEDFEFGMNHFLGGNNDTSEFGPEVGIAKEVEKPSAIIKICHGATALKDRWNPKSGDLAKLAIQQISNALTFLQSNQTNYTIKGALWMQGESDATSEQPTADKYYKNELIGFIEQLRKVDYFPIVLGEIKIGASKRWFFPHEDLVNIALNKVANEISDVYVVKTGDLSQDDDLHFDNSDNGVVKLGQRFYHKLQN